MPFSNSGVYTPPSGATTAVPGDVIRAATWNTIFIDMSTALTQVRSTWFQSLPVVTKTSSYTASTSDAAIIFNAGGTATLTLPAAATYPGRWLYIKTVANQAVIASATVVQPLVGPAGTLGTTICAATAGKFAQLTSDGTNWVIMAGN